MSLSAPPAWLSKMRNNKSVNTTNQSMKRDKGDSSIPSAPPAHLTAKGIAYEVDVPIGEVEEQKTNEQKNSEKIFPGEALSQKPSSPVEEEEFYGVPITAGEYGQARRGAAQERLLRFRLGNDAVNADASISSAMASTSIRSELSASNRLPPTEPGRLRLLNNITASFKPAQLTALMGSSGAG